MTDIRTLALDALLARVQAVCGATFATYSTRFRMWDDLVQMITGGDPNLPKFPAMFTYGGVGFGGGVSSWTRPTANYGAPPARIMTATLVIYARRPGAGTTTGPDLTEAGTDTLFPLIDAVEPAFLPDDSTRGVLTLGGTVQRCWLEGEGVTIPGDVDQTGLAMQTMPVSIMLP